MQNIIGKQPFVFAEDSVDPAAVPYRTVYTGAKLPAVGIGTLVQTVILPKTSRKPLRARFPLATGILIVRPFTVMNG